MEYRCKRRILNREISNGQETLKEMFLVIKEMQIKMTLRFPLIPIRMANIKPSSDTHAGIGQGEHSCIVGGSANSHSYFGNQFVVSQNIVNGSTSIPIHKTPRNIPKRSSTKPKRHKFNYVPSSFIHNSYKLRTNLDVPQSKNR
jgi:hypothetical protein